MGGTRAGASPSSCLPLPPLVTFFACILFLLLFSFLFNLLPLPFLFGREMQDYFFVCFSALGNEYSEDLGGRSHLGLPEPRTVLAQSKILGTVKWGCPGLWENFWTFSGVSQNSDSGILPRRSGCEPEQRRPQGGNGRSPLCSDTGPARPWNSARSGLRMMSPAFRGTAAASSRTCRKCQQ